MYLDREKDIHNYLFAIFKEEHHDNAASLEGIFIQCDKHYMKGETF